MKRLTMILVASLLTVSLLFGVSSALAPVPKAHAASCSDFQAHLYFTNGVDTCQSTGTYQYSAPQYVVFQVCAGRSLQVVLVTIVGGTSDGTFKVLPVDCAQYGAVGQISANITVVGE
jgi:hypothetical protein